MRGSVIALSAGLALLTQACGGEQQRAEPANTAAAAEPTAHSQGHGDMQQRMVAAVGTDVGDNWVVKMIEHHRGAVDMSKVALAQGVTGPAADLARSTIEVQTDEIAELERLAKDGPPDPRRAELYRPATDKMGAAMASASGDDPSETFLRQMMAHHQGAIEMSDIALANGADPALRPLIERVRRDQTEEVRMVQQELAG